MSVGIRPPRRSFLNFKGKMANKKTKKTNYTDSAIIAPDEIPVIVVKNLVLFPSESLLLVLFLRALIPSLKSLGYKVSDISNLHFTKKNIITLVILMIIGVAAVVAYVLTK